MTSPPDIGASAWALCGLLPWDSTCRSIHTPNCLAKPLERALSKQPTLFTYRKAIVDFIAAGPEQLNGPWIVAIRQRCHGRFGSKLRTRQLRTHYGKIPGDRGQASHHQSSVQTPPTHQPQSSPGSAGRPGQRFSARPAWRRYFLAACTTHLLTLNLGANMCSLGGSAAMASGPWATMPMLFMRQGDALSEPRMTKKCGWDIPFYCPHASVRLERAFMTSTN